MAQSAGPIEYTDYISAEGDKTPLMSFLKYDSKQYDAGGLGNAEYPFIAITPRSTLAWTGNSW